MGQKKNTSNFALVSPKSCKVAYWHGQYEKHFLARPKAVKDLLMFSSVSPTKFIHHTLLINILWKIKNINFPNQLYYSDRNCLSIVIFLKEIAKFQELYLFKNKCCWQDIRSLFYWIRKYGDRRSRSKLYLWILLCEGYWALIWKKNTHLIIPTQ